MLKILSVAAALVLAAVLPAAAQKTVPDYVDGCVYNSGGVSLVDKQPVVFQCTQDGKLQVNASVSASISGFAPNGNYASLTAGAVSSNVALPAGTTILVQNTSSTVTASVNLGVGAGTTATTSMVQIPPLSWINLTVGTNTFIAGITGSGSAPLIISGGAGLATGAGGGGGGSGGSNTYGSAVSSTGVNSIAAVSGAGVAVPFIRDASGALAVNIANGVTQSGAWSFTCISGCTGSTGTSQVNVNNGVTQSGNWSITVSPAGAWGVTQSGTWTSTPNGTLGSANPGNGFVAGAVAGNGTLVPLNRDAVGALAVNVASGVTGSISCSNCSGTTPVTGGTSQDSVPSTTPGYVPVQAFLYGYNPATGKWDRPRLDTSDNLMVNGGVTPGNFNLSSNVLGSPALSLAVTGTNTMAAGTSGSLIVPAVTTGGYTLVTPVPAFYSGVTGWHTLAGSTATSTNSTYVVGGPVTLYSMTALSTNSTSGYVRIYDTASAPTCSSSTGFKGSFPIPVQSSSAPSTSAPLASGFTINLGGTYGARFVSGIGYCLTADGSSTSNVAIGSTPNFINLFYN